MTFPQASGSRGGAEVAGLSTLRISSADGLQDVLAAALVAQRGRNVFRRSHVFLRLFLLPSAPAPPVSPLCRPPRAPPSSPCCLHRAA
jgi:hypothetical protein